MLKLLLALTIFSAVYCQKVQYYQELLQNKIEYASQFNLPTDNSYFFKNSNEVITDFGTFDFVIVGSGSAGSVVANRLSEIQDWKVLVLESGDDEDDFTDIPGMGFWSAKTERNWGYLTTPQTTCCLGMTNKQCNYIRGKAIGGSSTINAIMYVRGNPEDFNIWEKMGNPGWSYKDVLPYFKKSENSQVNGDYDYHGFGGNLNIDYSKPRHFLEENFEEALNQFGVETLDYNGKQQLGVGRIQTNELNGKRLSTGRAFLERAKYRKNLTVIKKALVTKVLLTNSKAEGVLFVQNGTLFKVFAEKEVILSAGAINSPQLLMLSGIGPKGHLSELGIEVQKSLPVGEEMQDHNVLFHLYFNTNSSVKDQTFSEVIQDFVEESGYLTYGFNLKSTAFIKVNNDSSPLPDIQLVLSPTTVPSQIPEQFFFNFNDQAAQELSAKNLQTDFAILVLLLNPKSRGTVRLQSNSPKDFPEINVNYFSDPENYDIETVYRGIKFVLNLIKTETFARRDTKLQLPINYKSCNKFKEESDYWYCIIRHLVSTAYHPVSTTAMGPNGVVDHKLKVHGIDKLRIVDAGVMPKITSGNTNAPTIMIAEKASDIIKKDHGKL